MQSDHFHSNEAMPPLSNQAANDYMHFPGASPYGSFIPPSTAKHSTPPMHGIEFQPSEVCPRNFIIFDQTDHRSQIMYNPAIAHRFDGAGLNYHAPYMAENFERRNGNNIEREMSSSLKEDSADIDALLSLEEEEEEEEEHDEEEVSTARTCADYGGNNSPDSFSTYSSRHMKKGSSSTQNSHAGGSSCNSERKRQKMKKMVKTLRGIVPGGDQMNTVTIIDEAVRYLKSLKVEAQKLGVSNFKN